MQCYIKNYPRPQFVRKQWEDLNGTWDFAFDDRNIGEQEKWYLDFPRGTTIRVPFTYETRMSGIHDPSRHDNIWYHRTVHADAALLKEYAYILHFEGADFQIKLWVNGQYAGCHSGGYARFSVPITDLLKGGENDLTVKVMDSFDLHNPRGKQRWKDENFSVMYVQSTGIWKTVWSEYVSKVHLANVKMTPDLQHTCLDLEADIAAPESRFSEALCLQATVSYRGNLVNRTCTFLSDPMHSHIRLRLDMHAPVSCTEEPLVKTWSPEHPELYDICFQITENGRVLDEVGSYFAMREIRIEGNRVLLNGHPLYQRLLLDQGYWSDSLLTPPSEEALVEDIDRILTMGFNGVRKHQKIEDERFLYWCDVKGLLVWSEMAAAFLYSDEAVAEFTREWLEIVKQNYNHPCIIAWTPFNESWGISYVKTRRDQQHFTQSIYHLTKAIDPYRPVITNDGWEHTVSDIVTIHDYCQDPNAISEWFLEHKDALLSSKVSPHTGRAVFADGFSYQGQPVIISECGGMAFPSSGPGAENADPAAQDAFISRFRSLTVAIAKIPYICGYCYTQFADVQQEVNGMMDMDRNFKIDPSAIRKINLP